MKYFFLILTLGSAMAQDIFVPFFDSGNNHLLPGLMAYWQFEETTGGAADSSGNGRTLTANGSTLASATGVIGNGRDFTAADADYFSLPYDAAFRFPGGAFTIAAWGQFGSHGVAVNDMTVAIRGHCCADTDLSWWLGLDHATPNDIMQFNWSTDGTYQPANTLQFTLSGAIGLGWKFILVRWDGTTLRLSMTPQESASLAASVTTPFAGPFHDTGSPPIFIGGIPAANIYGMNGGIDEIEIYDRALSDCEAGWLFKATRIVFDPNPCLP